MGEEEASVIIILNIVFITLVIIDAANLICLESVVVKVILLY